MKAWLAMGEGAIAKTGFPGGLDRDGLIRGFVAHNEAVRKAIPANQLLVYEVKEGGGSLCQFFGVPVPAEVFPRTNDRAEFWHRVTGKIFRGVKMQTNAFGREELLMTALNPRCRCTRVACSPNLP
jgi:hypothetical protein